MGRKRAKAPSAKSRPESSRRAWGSNTPDYWLPIEGGPSILVLGDGDFSFSKGLVEHLAARSKDGTFQVVATSFDSASQVARKYESAAENLAALKSHPKAHVLHRIDGTKLAAQRRLTSLGPFHLIVWHFPHSGKQRVHLNRVLLQDFFASSLSVLHASDTARVLVTLKEKPPYTNWNIAQQAGLSGFRLEGKKHFNPAQFPGYRHRTTDPGAKEFDPAFCRTYVFIPPSARKCSAAEHKASDEAEPEVLLENDSDDAEQDRFPDQDECQDDDQDDDQDDGQDDDQDEYDDSAEDREQTQARNEDQGEEDDGGDAGDEDGDETLELTSPELPAEALFALQGQVKSLLSSLGLASEAVLAPPKPSAGKRKRPVEAIKSVGAATAVDADTPSETPPAKRKRRSEAVSAKPSPALFGDDELDGDWGVSDCPQPSPTSQYQQAVFAGVVGTQAPTVDRAAEGEPATHKRTAPKHKGRKKKRKKG